jgi:hypothetical protein
MQLHKVTEYDDAVRRSMIIDWQSRQTRLLLSCCDIKIYLLIGLITTFTIVR